MKKILVKGNMIDSAVVNKKTFNLFSFEADGYCDAYYMIIGEEGKVLSTQPSLEFMMDEWYTLTGKKKEGDFYQTKFVTLAKKYIADALKRDLDGNKLDIHVENLSRLFAHYMASSLQFIEELGELFQEHREDVATMCQEFLDFGRMPEEKNREARFVKATLPNGAKVLHDTYVTSIEYKPIDGEWDYLSTTFED